MYIHSSSTKEKDPEELADSIYLLLFLHLDQKFDNTDKDNAITLYFSEIEEILGESLPQEAKNDDTWWANDETNVQARAWRPAGWRTFYPNVNSAKITFVQEASFVQGAFLLKFLESQILNGLLPEYRYKNRIDRLNACMLV